MLLNYLNNLFNNYSGLLSQKFHSSEITQIISKEIPQLIADKLFIDTEKFRIYGSCGSGNWAEIPWVAILNKNVSTSTQNGYYVVYLFVPERKEFFLSLAIGWTQFEKEFGVKPGKEKIETLGLLLAKKLRSIPDGFTSGIIDLNAKGGLAKGYELGQIISKRYTMSDILGDKTLFNDLRSLIGTYEELTKYVGNSVLNLEITSADAEESEIDRKIAEASLVKDVSKELVELIAKASKEPAKRKEIILKKIVRNKKFADYVKQRARFVCEICRKIPFIQKNGNPYAEADHVLPLYGKGVDHPDNMRCLCAQCHAIITFGSEEEIRKLILS